MAVSDDLNQLAAQDVVYLKRFMSGGVAEVFRGKLRQTVNGEWVFNAFTGQNGVVGFVLGYVQSSWTSSDSPSTGIQVTMSLPVYSAPNLAPLVESIVLTTAIPLEFEFLTAAPQPPVFVRQAPLAVPSAQQGQSTGPTLQALSVRLSGVGASQVATVTVNLTQPAPAGGLQVLLTASSPLPIPAAGVLVPSGAMTGTVGINIPVGTKMGPVTVTGTLGQVSKSATFYVAPL